LIILFFYGAGDSCFANNVFPVRKKENEYNSMCGIVDRDGNVVLPLEYNSASPWFRSPRSLLYAKRMDKEFAFDLKGNPVNEKGYDKIKYYNDTGMAVGEDLWFIFENEGKTGWVDVNGKQHIN
jgi:hypothetical protein